MDFRVESKTSEIKVVFIASNELNLEYIKKEHLNYTGFNGEIGQVEKIVNSENIIFFVGIGNRNKMSIDLLRKAIIALTEVLNKSKLEKITISLIENCNLSEEIQMKIILDTIEQCSYQFLKYKTNKKLNKLDEVLFEGLKNTSVDFTYYHNLVNGKLVARDLVNEPANKMMPLDLANYVKELEKNTNIQVEILDEIQIANLKMHSYIAVAKASDEPYRLIVMRYNGNPKSKERLGFVGKGLTYDTGGLSLKSTNSMKTMKSDMGGAAAVIGAIKAISENKLKVNVTGIIAACENSVSGRSYRPGDIIDSMAGKTIYIGNTDAEGRLTLIDGVHYGIENENITKIIDIATLTGSIVHSLGEVATGVISNNDEFYKQLECASKETNEKVWRMPIFDEYRDMLKHKEADLTNSPGSLAGGITAGLFIGEFVQNLPWIHMDIAGTSYFSEKKRGIYGGTGEGVYNLYKIAELNSMK